MALDPLRYPIGRFDPSQPFSPETRAAAIDRIAALPADLRAAVAGLSERQLDTPYRPGGWSARQVVHHLADSHMNGLIRTKLALTEDNPVIKPYDENAWSMLADMRLPVEVSLALVEAVHTRWAAVYRSLSEAQYARTFVHPERRVTMTIEFQVHDYAWHSSHHLAHVTGLRQRERW